MRQPHILKAIRTNELPWECIWFDTETKPYTVDGKTVGHRLNFGWACYRRRLEGDLWTAPDWHYFESKQEFWEWVKGKLRPKVRLYMFSHNGAFDLPVLNAFNELQGDGWELLTAVIESPPVILRWRKNQHTIQFIDTLNIWRMALADVGKQVNLPKLKMPQPGASRARWLAYGRRDVKVIMRACISWFSFLDDYGLGGFAPTLASQAMRAFRRKYMDHEIYIDDDADALALARDAYHGGRVECSRIGIVPGPLWLVDINSMYPYIMGTELMPTRLIAHTRNVLLSDLQEWLKDRCVVAEVVIATDEPAYPAVEGDKLVFPVGIFTAHLCTSELKHALQRGEIISIVQASVYEAAPIFFRFVDELYALRLRAEASGDVVLKAMVKTLLNSLYGKFGQNGRRYLDDYHTEEREARAWVELDWETGDVWQLRQLGGLVQRYHAEGESRDSHPAIAAHVTAGARMHLWHLECIAGRENVYYKDTDSLLVNAAGLKRLQGYMHNTELGKLKVERELTQAKIYAPKDYEFDDYVRLKGVRKSADWLDAEDIAQQQWSSLKALVRRGDLTTPLTTIITKGINREYNKGIVLPDGRVEPLRFGLSVGL